MEDLNAKETRALLKILDEVNYVGFGEFARLDDEEEAAVNSALKKLAQIRDLGIGES